MPIETPTSSKTPSGNKTRSDFVLCQGFAFRLSDVDGFSHQVVADSDPITVVNFKAYTQTVPDAEGKLFAFLVSKIQPTLTHEDA